MDKIVVGVAMPASQPWESANLDAATRIAVRQACQLAATLRIPLTMVAVVPAPEAGFFVHPNDAKQHADAEKNEAQQLLTSLQQEYADSGVDITATAVFGTPWVEILKAGGVSRRTLTVCGTRTNSAVSRLLFGSTGLKLLRNAPGPVWLVKPRIDEDAVLDVLAATDLSEVGGDVIAAGVTLGQALPVNLTVMHVVDSLEDRRMARVGASEENLEHWRVEAAATAKEQLQEQLAGTDARTLEHGIQTQIAEGVADTCILSAIDELDIDLLVMASSGRGGIPGMLFGNTAERLLPELNCSLLAIKPENFTCPVHV